MPRDFANSDASQYSPAWDLQVGIYSDDAVAAGQNGLRTDADEVRQLAADGVVTGPGGLSLGSANIIINCPALAFLDMPAADAESVVPSAVNAGTGGQAGAGRNLPVLPAAALVLLGAGITAVAARRLVRR